jgi:hypothetical protein
VIAKRKKKNKKKSVDAVNKDDGEANNNQDDMVDAEGNKIKKSKMSVVRVFDLALNKSV